MRKGTSHKTSYMMYMSTQPTQFFLFKFQKGIFGSKARSMPQGQPYSRNNNPQGRKSAVKTSRIFPYLPKNNNKRKYNIKEIIYFKLIIKDGLILGLRKAWAGYGI